MKWVLIWFAVISYGDGALDTRAGVGSGTASFADGESCKRAQHEITTTISPDKYRRFHVVAYCLPTGAQ